jgi:hypothetical protein
MAASVGLESLGHPEIFHLAISFPRSSVEGKSRWAAGIRSFAGAQRNVSPLDSILWQPIVQRRVEQERRDRRERTGDTGKPAGVQHQSPQKSAILERFYRVALLFRMALG